jgi:hypothetical protein
MSAFWVERSCVPRWRSTNTIRHNVRTRPSTDDERLLKILSNLSLTSHSIRVTDGENNTIKNMDLSFETRGHEVLFSCLPQPYQFTMFVSVRSPLKDAGKFLQRWLRADTCLSLSTIWRTKIAKSTMGVQFGTRGHEIIYIILNSAFRIEGFCELRRRRRH